MLLGHDPLGAAPLGSMEPIERPSAAIGMGTAGQIRGEVKPAAANIQATTSVSFDATVVRAPYGVRGVAERLAEDPEYYQRLASNVAAELKREVSRLRSLTPNELPALVVHDTITTEVIRFHSGFEQVASDLSDATIATSEKSKADALERAASRIVMMRDDFAMWCRTHSEFVGPISKLAVVCTATYVLHQFGGAAGDVAAFISYAIVEKEKLANLLRARDGKDGHP